MYRTAKAQKNGFESAIFACKKYAEENTKYPNAAQLIKWCEYQNPKIDGVQHRFASIVIPILKYPEYKFMDYSRDHLCQFLYDYAEKEFNDIETNHDVFKIQKYIMDNKVNGKAFNAMKKKEWIQKLNHYNVSTDIAQTYYNIIKQHQRAQDTKHGVRDKTEDSNDTENDTKNEQKYDDQKEQSTTTTEPTPQPSTKCDLNSNHDEITKNTKTNINTDDTATTNGIKKESVMNTAKDLVDTELKENENEQEIINNMNGHHLNKSESLEPMTATHQDDIESISINSATQHEIESLKQENMTLNKKLKTLNCPTKEIYKLNLEELNILEVKLKNDLNIIQKAKEKLYADNFYCILCLKNQKNIVINQCNHFVLCCQCEQKLETKKCPKCNARFTNVTKLKLYK